MAQAPNQPQQSLNESGNFDPGVERQLAPGVELSGSVVELLGMIGPQSQVAALELIRLLITRIHPEYVPDPGIVASLNYSRPDLLVQPAIEWCRAVASLLNPAWHGVLDGRLLIIGLSRIDPPFGDFLRRNGVLEPIEAHEKARIEQVFGRPARPSTRSGVFVSTDPTPLHLDNPSTIDQLGRSSLAHALSVRLRRIWADYQRPSNGAREAGKNSFILHLHGPWGSGKTTLLGMVAAELRGEARKRRWRKDDGTQQPWIVVEFNAWTHQRLDPPWWPLFDAVYRQSLRQLSEKNHQRPWHASGLRIRETFWRLFVGRRDLLTASVVLGLAAAVVVLFAPVREVVRTLVSATNDKPVSDTVIVQASKVIAAVSGLLAPALVIARSSLSGSARAAQNFVDGATDPMQRISAHFRSLIESIDAPIMVIVDDLDRCQSAYAVSLLEGIQTLFGDSRVFYVLAADRRWLHACFQKQYESFATVVTEPGRELGSLFLEKAVQLSVALPPLSRSVQGEYWQRLISFSTRTQGGMEVTADARAEFEQAETEDEVLQRLSQPHSDPAQQQRRRQAAVERMASAAFDQTTTAFLQPFARFLEPNPRAMKRLLNAYAIERDLAVLRGLDVLVDSHRRKQLVLWTILSMRWPLLQSYFLDQARGNGSSDDAIVVPNDEVKSLWTLREVQEVIDGEDGAKLNLEAVRLFVGV